MVRGLQSAGVAACIKHFPGAGEAEADPHHGLVTVSDSWDDLDAWTLVPFEGAIGAGARMVMSGHIGLPAVTGRDDLPATLSREVMTGLLRDHLGFDGVSITDALDMAGVGLGPNGVPDVIAALRAGVDLLLTAADPVARERIEATLADAVARGALDAETSTASERRLAALREWLKSFGDPPDIDVVGGAEHRALAAELAARSITIFRDPARLLPIRWEAVGRVLAVMPRPTDLTPADTSSTVSPTLASALRRRLAGVAEILLPAAPGEADIAGLGERLATFDVVLVGTFSANLQPAQAALAAAVLGLGKPTITIALRTPWDLLAYPSARTHVCSYGILPPSMEALAAALLGEASFAGRLPVDIDGLYPRGHGLPAWD
jgi:beta-N-acetylhexosaminidase